MPKKTHMLMEPKLLKATVVSTPRDNPDAILVKFAPLDVPTEVLINRKKWQDKNHPLKIGSKIFVEREAIRRRGHPDTKYYAIKFVEKKEEE